MELRPLTAEPLTARSGETLRAVARCIGVAHLAVPADLAQRGAGVLPADAAIGRVHAGGRWQDPAVCAGLKACLFPPLAGALRDTFEWYACRGAHFHNDAHYADVLFGVWCVAGSASTEVVFARSALRVPTPPGTVLVFDPFEVHGVLKRGTARYDAADYAAADPSVFVGFEVELTPAVKSAFGIDDTAEGRVVSSTTRVSADTGALDGPDRVPGT